MERVFYNATKDWNIPREIQEVPTVVTFKKKIKGHLWEVTCKENKWHIAVLLISIIVIIHVFTYSYNNFNVSLLVTVLFAK